MVLSKVSTEHSEVISDLTSAKKRRLRRKKLLASRVCDPSVNVTSNNIENPTCLLGKIQNSLPTLTNNKKVPKEVHSEVISANNTSNLGIALVQHFKKVDTNNRASKQEQAIENTNMSSNQTAKSREEVLAAREAKKQAKLKGKNNNAIPGGDNTIGNKKIGNVASKDNSKKDNTTPVQNKTGASNCVDEVDRAAVKEPALDQAADNQKTKEQIIAERAAKKAAKQARRKGPDDVAANPDMTVKDVVETLKDIKNVAKDIQDITAKKPVVNAETNKAPGEDSSGKSKAELRAERRAKQEAQRAAKQATVDKAAKAKPEPKKPEVAVKPEGDIVKEKSPKPKSLEKAKPKSVNANRVNWFQHLYTAQDKDALQKVSLNSTLHPAIVRLGVQLASRVITGSNARCIALLNAIKEMVKDYTLPAKTEFSRGLESHLTASLEYLWAMRQPSAAQTNAVKYFRHQLTQLPNNVDEFDAKKRLQEEIDHYIEDQIDKAGEAISMAVQKKISTGDNILTYGCSSLIERILREAWSSQLKFRTVIVGDRVSDDGREMLRRLVAAGLPCSYVDITAISFVMNTIDKVLLGASSLLVNGSVLGAAGTAQVALAAAASNVPVLVACETHKFSERVQTDAFVYNELGDPDALIDKNDENSPLKDWRSNPNLTPLNLTYDVTPASLVTAVITEKAILPCTSAPVVLRTKLTEYGM